ncbi:hypothetical protein EDD16DRAFT_1516626 [Pisolithus croceorrhizus]|nr:hypothetical protein EDD16DRAFT_1516626 [Pisolithus croceorrhizus]KAI6131729.1 hypothetical protein EV401DRAFT_1883937 [Pisolithus croceorrhizus]KAI6162709.1 hypothetical protein EDD17DRAFT_1507855 [Pisolithus thermaeus]
MYHTGIYACLFITCSHVYDMHTATWFGTDNIMDFWEDQMKLSPDYIIKQLDLWACNEEKNIKAYDLLENMQKQAKNGLNLGFDELHCLWDAIRDNSFQWVKMTPTQCHDYHKQMDARHKAGKIAGVPHQGHSDKRKKHKVVNENNPWVSKKAHRGQTWTTPKSHGPLKHQTRTQMELKIILDLIMWLVDLQSTIHILYNFVLPPAAHVPPYTDFGHLNAKGVLCQQALEIMTTYSSGHTSHGGVGNYWYLAGDQGVPSMEDQWHVTAMYQEIFVNDVMLQEKCCIASAAGLGHSLGSQEKYSITSVKGGMQLNYYPQ